MLGQILKFGRTGEREGEINGTGKLNRIAIFRALNSVYQTALTYLYRLASNYPGTNAGRWQKQANRLICDKEPNRLERLVLLQVVTYFCFSTRNAIRGNAVRRQSAEKEQRFLSV